MASAGRLADALDLPVEDVVRAAGGEETLTPATGTSRGLARFPNPAYAVGIRAATTQALSSPPSRSVRDDAGRVPVTSAAPAADDSGPDRLTAASAVAPNRGPARPPGVEEVARDVGRALRRLPPEGRLDALALAQSRIMAEMVQDQVRRATES